MEELELVNILSADQELWEKMLSWRTHESVAKYFGSSSISKQEHFQWVQSLKSNKNRIVFSINVEGEPVGICGLKDIDYNNKNAEFEIYMNPNVSGKGIGFSSMIALLVYGFKKLDLKRVYAFYNEKNIRAKNLYDRLGFIREGRLRKNVKFEGNFVDSFLISMLRNEWIKRKSELFDSTRFEILDPSDRPRNLK